jgi:hypothetical protein
VARLYLTPKTANTPVNRGFNFGSGEWEHERAKFIITWCAKKLGMEVITEAEEKSTGLVRDVVILDNGRIIEVEINKERAKRFDGKNVEIFDLW